MRIFFCFCFLVRSVPVNFDMHEMDRTGTMVKNATRTIIVQTIGFRVSTCETTKKKSFSLILNSAFLVSVCWTISGKTAERFGFNFPFLVISVVSIVGGACLHCACIVSLFM